MRIRGEEKDESKNSRRRILMLPTCLELHPGRVEFNPQQAGTYPMRVIAPHSLETAWNAMLTEDGTAYQQVVI